VLYNYCIVLHGIDHATLCCRWSRHGTEKRCFVSQSWIEKSVLKFPKSGRVYNVHTSICWEINDNISQHKRHGMIISRYACMWCASAYNCAQRYVCMVLYLYIYIALLAVHTNQKRFQCERPREKRAVCMYVCMCECMYASMYDRMHACQCGQFVCMYVCFYQRCVTACMYVCLHCCFR